MQNQIFNALSSTNELISLLRNDATYHLGYVYRHSYEEAFVLTNDDWKIKAGGVPQNCILFASSLDVHHLDQSHETDRELVLLRVLGPTPLPNDSQMINTIITNHQRRESPVPTDPMDGFDPLTLGELQFGGLECRVLGTLFVQEGKLLLGSDVESFSNAVRLRVYKPSPGALSRVVNYVADDRLHKAKADAKQMGFSALPEPVEIGEVRYTSSTHLRDLIRGTPVTVSIQPFDLLARRTAIFGMTRTGKSNTVKTLLAEIAIAAKRANTNVGQIVFDLNGEYANINHQDDGSSIADVFPDDTIRYSSLPQRDAGVRDLRNNFYVSLVPGLTTLQFLLNQEKGSSNPDIRTFAEMSIEEPEADDISGHKRWETTKAIYQCVLYKAGFRPPEPFAVKFAPGIDVLLQIYEHLENQALQPSSKEARKVAAKNQYGVPLSGITLDAATTWFLQARQVNKALRSRPSGMGIVSSSGNPYFDASATALLNLLAQKNDNDQAIRGYRTISPYTEYHSVRGRDDIGKEIYQLLKDGQIVILDLSIGPPTVREAMALQIASQIFNASTSVFTSGRIPSNITMYIEEAHNLIGKRAELNEIWPRIAKEGAKFRIGLTYSTQEPSSIHPNILANTENWFVTHLNNDDELRTLSKFYDFEDFRATLKRASDVGFARIKTLSGPFVIPVQIRRFDPVAIKARIRPFG